MKFKRGAFAAMRPVTPAYVKLSYFGPVSPVYDVCNFWDLVILLLSSFTVTHVTVHVLPKFTPNDVLLNKKQVDIISANNEEHFDEDNIFSSS